MRRIRVTLISHILTKWLERIERTRRTQVKRRASNYKGSEDFGGLAKLKMKQGIGDRFCEYGSKEDKFDFNDFKWINEVVVLS